VIITVRRLGPQPCWSEPWMGFSVRTGQVPLFGLSLPLVCPYGTLCINNLPLQQGYLFLRMLFITDTGTLLSG
jgi:hypothetical protein